MGWLISSGKLAAPDTVLRRGCRHGEAATMTVHVVCATPDGAAGWSFTPNADRTTFITAGAFPAWQARRVCQSVLSTLVGFD